MDFLQLNKFGDLHNGRTIIFCKAELVNAEFKRIEKIRNEVVLISGNSDDEITESLVSNMPENIVVWYCQNNLVNHPKLRSIPIGLENTIPNKRKGHGVAWPHAIEKVQLLGKAFNTTQIKPASGLLYANFNVQTDIVHRKPIMEFCKKSTFISWDEPNLSYTDFIEKVLDHEAVICPAGNGIDTHRLYEILYCKRIPVTFKVGDYAIYNDLYDKLPIVTLDSPEELSNEEKIKELIAIARQKTFDNELLDFTFWKESIIKEANHIVIKRPSIMGAISKLIKPHL